ncbi:MAG: ChbG/HpnK family deacetylase [Clostridiales bacterium]|nr:ChbG/HpnK family deacetylase [Clostridiales bacterium]
MSMIINADDFGKSKEVNSAIVEAFDKGFIHRTTLMVNMPYADEAVKLAEKSGFADKVGLHLNLTEGEPLTDGIKSNPLFCDENGHFHALFHMTVKHRLYMNRKAAGQVYDELKAQLEKYREYGFCLWHIDSHHHVHTDYPVYKALKKLSREYRFSSVRISRNLYFGGNLLMRLYKWCYNCAVRGICEETTDLFGSYQDLKAVLEEHSACLSIKERLEIMVHPMYDANGVLVDVEVPMEEEKRDAFFDYYSMLKQ